ncbi:PAS domain-containing sensor histidine kinase [Desulfobacula sp.]|uniref:sensor histidine kinase n=1 Tax=Desulfobacula sp. TaxID=2593537 RepID=UPI00262F24EA|nr:PAS domain-containing sensor histidine kinase [Desulfobacula sp.]
MENGSEERAVFYQVLTRKIRSLILIVSFLPMILTTGILFYRFHLTYTKKTQAHISELIQKHSDQIDTFLFEKVGNIKYLAHHFDRGKMAPKIFLKENFELLKSDYGDVFTDVGLVDENGIQFAYEGPFKLENANYSTAKWFIEAKEKPFYISDVFTGLRGHPHFIIAVKINSDDSNYVLRSTINFGAFNSLVENIHIGKTGFAFIINANSTLQTKRDIGFDPSIAASMVDRNLYKNKKTFFTKKQDASGNHYIVVTSMLNNIDWVMVFQQDLNDAFHDMREAQYLALAIFMIGSIAILWVIVALPRKIVKLMSSSDKKSEAMNRQVVESGRLASIGELAAGIAHEINNPVAIMVEEAGWIGDLLEEEDLRECENLEEFTRALGQIQTQGRRCKEITHKLLSFARKTDSTINDVQINTAVTEIVSLTAQMARYNNVTIKTELYEKIPYIKVSLSELQQVILNLINNAIDAMEKTGGVITIETKTSTTKKNHIVIAIEDNGPGIPKDNLHRIFDPFFTTKPVGQGTGLGLSICYGIIQRMSGKIEVYSHVGVGTKFRIWIPFQEDTEINGEDLIIES